MLSFTIRSTEMLLICGGESRKGNLEDPNEGIPLYPPVLFVLEEGKDPTPYMANVIEPFIVRLSDKDLVKIINSPAGRKALNV